ncbi:unnamed protein product [Linum trigynum]|uniref:Uncharacterized protein n=1 Tax=Linum trigynum TaxID=586398 RepID=A0AAV2FB84_9ROSI
MATNTTRILVLETQMEAIKQQMDSQHRDLKAAIDALAASTKAPIMLFLLRWSNGGPILWFVLHARDAQTVRRTTVAVSSATTSVVNYVFSCTSSSSPFSSNLTRPPITRLLLQPSIGFLPCLPQD